jgi:hypothetical protein
LDWLIGRQDPDDHATWRAVSQVAPAGNAWKSRASAGVLSLPILESMPEFFEIIFTAQ